MTEAVVAGAGVIGAAVTFHLAHRGVRVHCVDPADRVSSGTTAVGFGTATAYQRFPKAYFDINRAGILAHAELADRFGDAPWWHRSGTIGWVDDESFSDYVDQLADWDCPIVRHRGREAAAILDIPVTFPPDVTVAVLPDEGWIDGVAFTERLLAEAAACGAIIRLGAGVDSVALEGGRIASIGLSDGQRLPADVLINATGSAADEVAGMVGARPFLGPARRSLMVRLFVDGEPLRHILRTPELSIRPDGPGQVVMRSDQVDRLLADRPGTPDPELVKELLDRATRTVPPLSTATVREAVVVDARCPRDGLPSIGPLPSITGYYEAVASAGVTLAPVFGTALAGHIVSGETDELIAPFSPNRFNVENPLANSLTS